jgi:hypothetical protein
MTYQFKNLIFEGGGVKGIAYVGAIKVLEKKGVMSNIVRVGVPLPVPSMLFWSVWVIPPPRH